MEFGGIGSVGACPAKADADVTTKTAVSRL